MGASNRFFVRISLVSESMYATATRYLVMNAHTISLTLDGHLSVKALTEERDFQPGTWDGIEVHVLRESR